MDIARLISIFLPIEQRSGGFLYDYQTLITGFLAVAAAFVTIGMMAWTESRSQSRHEATLRIVLEDRIIAWDHLINPQLVELKNEYDRAKNDLSEGSEENSAVDIVNNAYAIFMHFTNVVSILERPQVVDARSHVSGVLIAALDDVRKSAKDGAHAASFVLQLTEGLRLRPEDRPEALGSAFFQKDISLASYVETVKLCRKASIKRGAELIAELEKLDAQLRAIQ